MRKVCLAALAAALPVLFPVALPAATGPLSVINYHLLSEVRQTRTTSLFTYSADLQNTGQAQPSITATVTSLVPGIVIQSGQGSLHFPPVGANATVTSTDFFAVMVDRTIPVDFSNLVWAFSTPVANAGPNQSNVGVGTTVTLNGSASTNPSGIGTLTYSWAFAAGGRPAGSAAVLLNPTSVSPTFVPDVAGLYTVSLTVSNGAGVNTASVAISTIKVNHPPVANAGPDQSLKHGTVVTLNGSGSSDADGDPLTYLWSLVQVPTGSNAALDNPTSVNPKFTADKVGTYKAQLVVNDGQANSAPVQVTISSTNIRPLANAVGPLQVSQGAVVQLTGAGSTDADGDPLTYRWSFNSVPGGSTAALSSTTIVNPTFTADKTGTYVVQLVVNDGFDDSIPSTVTITTNATILAPTADAGPAQALGHGTLVTLDGSKSSDPQGLPLTYRWSLTSKPTGSTALLAGITTVAPTFTADRPGTYVAQLIVNNGTLDSLASTVTISTSNTAPVADAGAAQLVPTGTTVTLNGGASSDADHDPLTYSWSLTTIPAGSAAILLSSTIVSPTFVADVAGTYVAQLIVNDGFTTSAPKTVTITATSGITLTPSPINISLNGTGTMTLSIGVPAGPGGQDINLAVIDTTVVTAPLKVTVPASASSTTFTVTAVGAGTTTIIASAAGSGLQPGFATVNVTTPTITLSVSNSTVGLTKTVTGTVTLSAPAPAGGVTVALTAAPTGVVTIPASVTIATGTTASFIITGKTQGTTTITASSASYQSGTVGVTATQLGLITLQSGLSVVSSQTVPLAVGLVSPAPVGGVTIALTSADPSTVTVTPTVFIAGGATAPDVSAQVTGIKPGVNIVVTAAADGFGGASTTVTVIAGLIVSPASLPVGTVNVLYPTTTVSATGGTPPYTFTAVGLPNGLSFNTTTGVISGTPTSFGTGTITVADSGTGANQLSRQLSLTVNPSPLVVTPSDPLPLGTAGQPYTLVNISASGGTPPYVLSAASLPAGLNFNTTTGDLSGTPTAPGTATITVKDSATTPQVVTRHVTIAPSTLIISPTTLANGTQNVPYPAVTVSATGGTAPYTLSATNLPAGLAFNTTTGVLNGTPTGFGTGTITVTDAGVGAAQQTKSVTVLIVPTTLQIQPSPLPAATKGQVYGPVTLTAIGGVAPFTFTSTAVPAGLSFNTTTHVLSGTPTALGPALTITVTDNSPTPQTSSVTLTINPETLTVTPNPLPVGIAGTAYPTTTLVPAGGTAPYTFSSTTLPNGMAFNTTTGVLSGTPTVPGSATVTVKDSATTPQQVVNLTLTINPAPLVISPAQAAVPAGAQSVPYQTTTFSATGGTPPYILSATGLPTGLTFNTTTGVLSGTPNGAGIVIITIKDSAASPQQDTRQVTISAGLVLLPNPLPTGTAGSLYPATTVTISGGNAPYTLSATGLPNGLTFNTTTGLISGTPTVAANATISVVDSTPGTHLTASLPLIISPVPLVITPSQANIPNGLVNVAYPSTTFVVSGGTPPYVLTGTNIPTGMTFVPATGVLSGTPQVAGTGTISVHDSSPGTQLTGSRTFTINAQLTVLPASLPIGAVGAVYPTTTVTPSGGNPPYIFTATGIPNGLTFNTSTGVLSGTPQAVTTAGASITVKDSTSPTAASISLNLTVNSGLVVSPSSLLPGTVGVAYPTVTVSASGGTTPYTFSVTGLPNGLSFNTTTGVLSGTPQAAGTATITVKDSTSGTGLSGSLTLVINPQLTVTPNPLPQGTNGVAYPTTTLVPSGGQTPYIFSASGLPSGLTFNTSTGVLSGTPTAATTPGSASITVTDSSTPPNSVVLAVTIRNAVLTLSHAPLASGVQNSVYNAANAQSVTATGGTTPYTFTATGLPSGLSLRTTGQIQGTPSVSGTFPVNVTVTDAVNATDNFTFSLVIAPQPPVVTTTGALIPGTVTVPNYLATLAATGGTPPYNWSLVSGSLPAGLSLSSNGRITGTPTVVGTSNFVVQVQDSAASPQTAQSGTLSITINPILPFLTITGANVGKDLETTLAVTLNNFTSQTNVTISSDNPLVLLTTHAGLICDLSSGNCVGGAQSITINNVTSNFIVYAEALAGSGSANITAHASLPGSIDGTSVVTMTPSGFVLSGPNGVGGSLLLNQNSTTPLTVVATRLDSGGNIQETQAVRADFITTCPSPNPGGPPIQCTPNPIIVSLGNSNTAAGNLVPTSVAFGGGVDTIPVNFVSATSVSTQTSTVITVNEPATFTTPTNNANVIPITVQPTSVTLLNVTVGKGLETTSHVTLGAKVTQTTPVTITSLDPTKAVLSTAADVAGSTSIVMNVVCTAQGCGSATQDFYVQGLVSTGTVGFTATAGALTGTGLITLTPAGFVIESPFGGIGNNFNDVSGNFAKSLNVDAVRLDAAGNIAGSQQVAGTCTLVGSVKTCSAPPLSVPVTSSNHAVGTLTTPVTFAGGIATSTTTWTPLGAGSTVLAVGTPAGFSTPATGTSLTATVTNPGITLNGGFVIGQDLEQQGTFFLGVAAPSGGAQVLLTVTSGAAQLSNTPTGAGASSITVNVPAGQFVGSYYIYARNNIGNITISAQATGYSSITATDTLAPSGIVVSDVFLDIDPTIGSFDINTQVGNSSTFVAVSTAVLDPNTFAFQGVQSLAPTSGNQPLQASVISGTPSVGTIDTPATIAIGTGSTSVHFTPIASGTTTITAHSVGASSFATPSAGKSVNVVVQ